MPRFCKEQVFWPPAWLGPVPGGTRKGPKSRKWLGQPSGPSHGEAWGRDITWVGESQLETS